MPQTQEQLIAIKKTSYKLAKFAIAIILIGFVDSQMPHLITSQVWYQIVFLLECLIGSTISLLDKNHSTKENIIDGFVASILLAGAADFASASFQLGKIAYPLPSWMFSWRNQVFGNTPFMPLVHIIEAPSILIPGGIFGYDIGIFAVILYFGGKFVIRRMLKAKHEKEQTPTV